MTDDEFTPQLGKMRAKGGRKARTYLGQVVAAAARAGGGTGRSNRRFDGSRIGRGASMGRLLGSRDRHAGLRARRAVVKTRLVRLGAKGLSAATAHLRYIQRDGVTREGDPGRLYSQTLDEADGKAFLERSTSDRHQFRFIVSAEDGAEYPDLKPFIRRLMTQVEADLGTKLDWVAVDHFNTGHPHTHIMLRGKDDRGENLIIAREYISHGLRARATELVTLDLGPRTDLEIEARLRHDISEERLTAIDRRLVREMDADRIVVAGARDPFQQSLCAGRLQKLGEMGLAEPMGAGRWQLADELEDTLRRIGERGDIIRTMQRDITARKLDRSGVEPGIFDPDGGNAAPLTGRVVARGLVDELHDRHYLLVDGTDGRIHHVDIGRGETVEPTPEGAIVRIVPRSTGIRDADRTVADVAAANGGLYSIDLHLRHDPAATEVFAETHVRRLEAMRRLMGSVERQPDGSWTIAPDHLDRAAAFEVRQARDRPVTVEILSATPLDRLPGADAATWLDRTLVGADPVPLRDAGFGHDVRESQKLRRQWLLEQGLAEEQDGAMRYRAGLLATLQRRELLRVAGRISDELGLPFAEARNGERIAGVLTRRVDLSSGRFALVEKSREFTLVPWRPVLERQVGKQVGGIMRDDGISWTTGRGRSGPEIS
jgi:type IV secretory pathway VirD2 relaxase